MDLTPEIEFACILAAFEGLLASGRYTRVDAAEGGPEILRLDSKLALRRTALAIEHALSLGAELCDELLARGFVEKKPLAPRQTEG